MSIGPGIVLYVVLLAVVAYALYWIVRKAVAHGIRDARRAEGSGPTVPAELRAWRRDGESAGHSVARLERTSGGRVAHGVEVLAGEPVLACWFRVDLTDDWRASCAAVRVLDADGERALLLEQTDGVWTADGTVRDDLADCVDVDVAATPLTNTFPIRRLSGLTAGESSTAAVAWVEVPSLRVLRVEQTYERLADRRWRYSDPMHGAFLLEVDADGLVERYEGFAIRVR